MGTVLDAAYLQNLFCGGVKDTSSIFPNDLVSTNGGVADLCHTFSCMFART